MDDDLIFCERIDGATQLCISQLSSRAFAGAHVDGLGSGYGFFVYEISDDPAIGGVTILAKAASLEAAFRIADLWRTSANTAAMAA